ncbi:MAG: DUF5348 domain-containing protein [Cellulosilyticum sp.]|nr:DUF5348 domain-containing protein [Cellulosilyticum sp.]
MKERKIYKNAQGRFQVEEDCSYFTSGDSIILKINDEWVNGIVEHDGAGEYGLMVNGEMVTQLCNGMTVRID